MEIKHLKNSIDIVELIGATVTLKRDGTRYKGLCPFHSEKTPSFTVDPKKQRFTCYGCGEKGDVIDFVEKIDGCDTVEALKKLSGGKYTPPKSTMDAPVDAWTAVFPCPELTKEGPGREALTPEQMIHPKLAAPDKFWVYRSAASEPLYYILRWDASETLPRKEFRPLAYFVNAETGEAKWRWALPSAPRPLYGLDSLAKKPSGTVIITEGEKAADAAALLFPKAASATWHGGRGAVRLFDWSVLKGRRVIMWPDNDYSHEDTDGCLLPWEKQPGNDAMLTLNEILEPICSVIKWAKSPEGTPCGWDVADADWTPAEAKAYIKGNLYDVPEMVAANTEQGEKEEPGTPAPSAAHAAPTDYGDVTDLPCRALGYSTEDYSILYWFLERDTETILRFTSRQLQQEHHIKELAPANYWEQYYPARTAARINTSGIGEMLRLECKIRGFFDMERIRGRGAWMDDGRLVIHAGDQLIVEGEKIPLPDIDSRFAYQKKKSIGMKLAQPMKTEDSRKVLELFSVFAWERSLDPWLIAGWVALAPLCGALNWRPHLWVTGGAGTGKSWILQKVVRPLLGSFHLAVQSKTTEAAIRQTIDSDGLPVVYDEFEAETEHELLRVQAVLDLARSASSADGGAITKGGKNGKATQFVVRSSFMFASIACTLEQASDRGRVTVLNLRRSGQNEKIENARKVYQLITDDYALRLQNRTIDLLPIIQANILTLRDVVADKLGDTRMGDQIGTLLAGATSLISDGLISVQQAKELVDSFDWDMEVATQEVSDESRCLATIMEHLTSFDANGARVERTVAELVAIAIGERLDRGISSDVANRRLYQMGLKADMKYLYIANTSLHVKKIIMRGTPWGGSWAAVLGRMEGVVSGAARRFGDGLKSRTTMIPLRMLNVMSGEAGQIDMFDERGGEAPF